MTYRFEPDRSVAENVRRIAIEEIDDAIARCDSPDAPDERVHDLRKLCKRLRALVRLAHDPLAPSGTYRRENAAFRDAADALGGVRDRQAMIETCDALLDRYADEAPRASLAPIRRALYRKLREAGQAEDMAERLAAFRAHMVEARERVADWPLEEDGFDTVRDGLARSYRRGRKARKLAQDEPTAENFHEWRKRTKYHWYHLRLIEPLMPEAVKKRRKRAKALEKALGTHHDLAVLRADLATGTPAALADRATAALVELIDRRSREIAADAHALGRKVYRQKTRAFVARTANLWPDCGRDG